jgi:Glycosyltransferase family 87
LVAAVALAYVLAGAGDPWDFETYYYAGAAFRNGQNPYSVDVLSSVASQPVELPYLYPPITLRIFAPWSTLPIGTATLIWLTLKCSLLVLLIWLWHRVFLRVDGLLLLTVTLLGFNMAVLWDLRTGNVALIESAILWLAFTSYRHGRLALTTCLIALASMFKLLPILLLGVVLLSPGSPRKRVGLIALGLGVFLLILAVPTGLTSEWLAAAAQAGASERPTGEINPSALGLADWLVGVLEFPAHAAQFLAIGLYVAYAAIILVAGFGAVLRARTSGSSIEQVTVVVLLWLLLLPRVMVYSYVMAIVPVIYVLRSRMASRLWQGVFLGLILVEGLVRLMPGRPPAVLGPLSFFLLLASFALYVARRPGPPEPTPRRSAPDLSWSSM